MNVRVAGKVRHLTYGSGTGGALRILGFLAVWLLLALAPLHHAGAQAQTGTITGAVKNQNNIAIPGATVEFKSADGTQSDTVLTDSTGAYQFVDMPGGVYTVTVSKDSFSPTYLSANVYAGETTVVDFLINRWASGIGSIAGTVKDRSDAAVPGAIVQFENAEGVLWDAMSTDSEGKYQFTGLPAGAYTVAAYKSGFPRVEHSFSVSAGQTTTANIVIGDGTGSIIGIAKNGISTDFGVSGATIQLLDSGNTPLRTTLSDSRGNYQFIGLPAGAYKIVANKDGFSGYSSSPLDVAADQITVADLRMYRLTGGSGKITGTVSNRSNNALIPGATVQLFDSGGNQLDTVLTNSVGNYQFEGLAAGNYTVIVDKNGFSRVERAFSILAGQTQTLNITLGYSLLGNGTGSITGTIKNPDNTAVPGLLVQIRSGDVVYGQTSTDNNGSYSFTGLNPGSRTYQVVVIAIASERTVTVYANQTMVVDFITSTPGTVTGTVKNQNNIAIHNVPVEIRRDGVFLRQTSTDENGRYSFTGLSPDPGIYQVVVRVGGSPPERMVLVSAGQTTTADFIIEDSTGTIRGTIKNQHNITMRNVPVEIWREGVLLRQTLTDDNGGYSFTGMSPDPGIYQVVVRVGGSPPERTVTVSAGQTTTADFVIGDGAGAITGTIKNQDNIAVSGMPVQIYSGGVVYGQISTDNSGNYGFAGLNPNVYQVRVLTGGYPPALERTVTISANQTTTVDFVMGSTGSISGTVKNQDDIAVPGIQVYVMATDVSYTPPFMASTSTDNNGNYNFAGLSVYPGTYKVAVMVGNSPFERTASVYTGQTTTVDFVINRPDSIAGRVVNQYDAAVPGVSIQVWKDGPTTLLGETITDNSGNYRFAVLPAGTYRIQFEKEGFAPGVLNGIQVYDDRTTTQNFQFFVTSLAKIYTDKGVDDNDDTVFESLQVDAGVWIGKVGHYSVEADLKDGEGNLITSARTEAMDIPFGLLYNVAIFFDGRAILDHGRPGPYRVDNIRLYDSNGGPPVQVDIDTDGYTTQAYALAQFDCPPVVSISQPDDSNPVANDSFDIILQATDEDTPATVSVYYDIDNTGNDGTLIAGNLPADGERTVTWDTSAVPAGAYYIYAVAADGIRPAVTSYSRGTVQVQHGGGEPAVIQPDLLIKNDEQADDAYGINDAYQTIPDGEQVESLTVPNGQTRIFQVKVENDSDEVRSFVIKAQENQASGYTTAYAFGATNITAQIRSAGGYITPVLEAGGHIVIEVAVTASGVAPGTEKTILVEAFLDGDDTTVRDVVAILTSPPPVVPNTPPVIDAIGDKSVAEEAVLTFSVSAADADLPAQALTFSTTGLPTGASFDPATRIFAWTPSEAQGPGSYNVTFIVSDGQVQESETITITVQEVNQAPVLNPIGNKTATAKNELTFTAKATDSDLPSQVLSYSLIGAPAGAAIDSATGVFTWTPPVPPNNSNNTTFSSLLGELVRRLYGLPAWSQSHTFKIRVSDGITSDEEEVTVIVTQGSEVGNNGGGGGQGNAAPVLAAIGNKQVDENTILAFTVEANDADTPATSLVYSASGLPAGASFNAATRHFSWQPTEAQGPGTYPVTFTVSDGALQDSETVTITVREVNSAPVLSRIGDKTVKAGNVLTFTAQATDADLPAQVLTYSLEDAPAGAVIDPSTGVFVWTAPIQPNNNGNGRGIKNFRDLIAELIRVLVGQSYTFKVKVSDGVVSTEERMTVWVN